MEQMTFWGPQITDEEWEFIQLLRLCRELEQARIYAGIGLSENRGNKYWSQSGSRYHCAVLIGSMHHSGPCSSLQEARADILATCRHAARCGTGCTDAAGFRKKHGAYFNLSSIHSPQS